MPRAPLSTESSKVYVGMLIVTCVAMLVGVTALALEAGEYDWQQTPPKGPSVQLPGPPKVEGSAWLDVPSEVAETPKPAAPAPEPIAPPVVAADTPEPPKPQAKPAEAKPVEVKPEEAKPLSSGPTPSPLIIPGR